MTADGDRLAALHEEMNRAIREIEGEHSGGFPQYLPSSVGPGFGRFLTAMRRLQDLAVSADMDDPRWDEAADLTEKLVELMDPFEAPEGVGPANRVADEPANGHLLLPPGSSTRLARTVSRPTVTSRGSTWAVTAPCTVASCRCCSITSSA